MTNPARAVQEFRLPDLGEGLTDADWVHWAVAVGDRVELNQVIGEVETAKATVELPSPYGGTVEELLVEPGQTVPVGAPLLRIATEDGPAEPAGDSGGPSRPSVLVGYGPGDAPQSRRATRRASADAGRARDGDPPPARPDAKPGARKLAALLEVDLDTVTGTGRGGVITRDDVRRTAGHGDEPTAGHGEEPTAERPHSPAPEASPERTTRIPVGGVRKRTAEAVSRSAFTAPHASVFLTCDATATVDLVSTLRASPAFEGVRPTALSIVSRALLHAIADEPSLNAHWDDDTGEIVLHHDAHLGIATATSDGLKVPVVREAQRLSLPRLARSIAEVADRARTGRSTPPELTGSTVSVTNVGVFGVDGGTPILNPGESAILAVGAISDRPWVVDGALAIRKVVTLSLSFDHRLVDGEQAGRALATIGAFLGDPVPMLLADR
ncbi:MULTISPECIES: dihydrolipoamide acetyltransferase family protein [Rhodococcus]|uniref:dihydrolipoamide acetyltransferase family protein n=1 Tax=Rhodococcus TaxID=1827 RepID=UPI001E3385C6|nr:dihydrolipoamide acetyltransferase family protein [Rhodococcus pyridinivorans]MCD2117719.1 2-oxo acid dehydrogenase subunit E2 [Rhodococcus pyridinivorans]MCZ4626697.1 dihydrolipoamide acetyltransferase family protein [Rhodococcus pyridinivorans]MCZ4647800.1 dihydrolipoamide acetyltransferase family protein [Rhodococcus pyridinivorans]MDJ0483048.1 dihydrolipoamide acetyltransferase family protein [Rhodococcus pyridinivorans]MDV7253969.1 dihydrolipoamide acetyltransferase family protein [Rho